MREPAQSGRRNLLHALTAGVFLCACPSTFARTSSIAVHSSAPDFTRPSITNHAPVHLRAFRGKVVLLNFWASWCGPCLEEMPRFARWQSEYGTQGLSILGVSMDDDVADARPVVARLGIHYPILMGDPALAKNYGDVLGLPVSFLIDRGGILRARIDGETNLDALEQRVRDLLGTHVAPPKKI